MATGENPLIKMYRQMFDDIEAARKAQERLGQEMAASLEARLDVERRINKAHDDALREERRLMDEFYKNSSEFWMSKIKLEKDQNKKYQDESSQYWLSKRQWDKEQQDKYQKTNSDFWLSKKRFDKQIQDKYQRESIEYHLKKRQYERDIQDKYERESSEYWLRRMDSERTTKEKRIRTAGIILTTFINALITLGQEGLKLASQTGLTLTEGIQLSVKNRAEILRQLGRNINEQVTKAQLEALQSGAMGVFSGGAAGDTYSSRSASDLIASVQRAFNVSNFNLNEQSLRNLITLGISTEAEMKRFLQISGRRSISDRVLNQITQKNSRELLIFGNRITAAAIEADRLGVSLSRGTAAQEGMVGNIEATLDTVAQLNQIGANIDFGQLIKLAETGTPDQLMSYLSRTVPESLLKNTTSGRILAEQLGLGAQDLIRMQSREETANQLYDSVFGVEEDVSAISEKMTQIIGLLGRSETAVDEIFGFSLRGALAGGALGAASAPVLGPAALIPAALGAIAGGFGLPVLRGNDVIMPAGGSKAILSAAGVISLNPNDTVVAGTNLGQSRGSGTSSDVGRLISKVESLINSIQSANVVVDIDGRVQRVPRVSVTGLRVRQEG